MDNTKTDMGLIELIILDVISMLIFVFMLFTAIICPAKNLFAINLPLVFGVVTLPLASTFGKWLNYLRYHENSRLAAMLNMDQFSGKLIFFDFGVKGHTWIFRAMSVVTAGFSIYNLIKYVIG